MGSGVSASDDFTSNEKETLAKVMEGKYLELKQLLSESDQIVALKE